MKNEFLEGCKSARDARKLAPWAVEVVKVDGGYRAFESVVDAAVWRVQK